ncbi:BadF/BadG/BcrA/BcrD ATPase family protein [Nonomuraea longicatena]|uniref:BadF/BadG/BcrA/BcrD ATPase family protein n=1 Tax=Nonomuraea longicatena TaxID=83682 RepID=A0ABP4AB14_9ACTN
MDVAIDGGQTGLRLAVAVHGRITEVGELPGLSYAEGPPVEAVLSRLDLPPGVDTVCLGLTTVLDDPIRLARALLGRARRVIVTTDVVTSHAGAFPSGAGVVLAAGTGAIALGVPPARAHTTSGERSPRTSAASGETSARTPATLTAGTPPATDAVAGRSEWGRPVQVDGWGFLYGDAGSGFWIGRRGLEAALRGFDGREAPGALTARAQEVFGDLATLPARLYLAPDAVARIARFAPHVIELAATDGTADSITDSAATELAGTVAAAARSFPEEVPVAWTGRLLRGELLRTRFEAALRARLPAASLRPAAGDSLSGAARLAAAADLGPYTSLATVVS